MRSATTFVAAFAFALGTTTTVAQAPSAERSGEQVVKAQCSKCHAAGVGGAPRIDDRAAWAPRMKNGLDAAVRSAIRGHGAMPARGGLADLTDTELRSAILYLFNPAGAPQKPAPAPVLGPNQRIVAGTEVYLGVTPKGGDLYHVNITLRDAGTHAVIEDAQIEVKVTNPVMGTETRQLDRVTINKAVSYGNDFRMTGKEPHTITVQIRRPQAPRVIEARFDYKG